jgi:hypothetical protein
VDPVLDVSPEALPEDLSKHFATVPTRNESEQFADSKREETGMDVLKALAISEGLSAALIAGTWYWVLRPVSSYENWRTKASFAALVLASIAVTVQFTLALVTQFYTLETLDSASGRGGWNAFAAHLWLWSFFATGFLAFGGLALAILGKGRARVPAGLWSCVVLGLFFVNLVLAVNSFH